MSILPVILQLWSIVYSFFRSFGVFGKQIVCFELEPAAKNHQQSSERPFQTKLVHAHVNLFFPCFYSHFRFFYSPNCLFSEELAPAINAVPFNYPSVVAVAVDATYFSRYNFSTYFCDMCYIFPYWFLFGTIGLCFWNKKKLEHKINDLF